MRHEYPLTPQTKEVLEDNVKAIADEAHWSKNYLYAILNEEKKDPYSPFRYFFRAIARKVPHKAHVYIDDMRNMLDQVTGKKSADIDRLKTRMRRSIFELIGAEIDRLPNAEKLKAVVQAKKDLENYERGLRFDDIEDSEVSDVSDRAS